MNHYTIGMAGHIDHGKTSLTKALTNIDTDRLKEEKERNISIELGYAPLKLNDTLEVSVIDVPGHERFIRQMIAGVAGIDLVILVVAADEGVMPQTREHLEILTLLGIEKGIIAVTKTDRVDEEMRELVELDIRETIAETFLADSEFYFVDSISGNGIPELKEGIQKELKEIPSRDAHGAFRLPIDQVFTIHGQGTVVRGTVYEGVVAEGNILEILPQGDSVRARQLQVHHQSRQEGRAGQRVAVNLGGVSKESVTRGDVLVAPGHYETTTTLDVSLKVVKQLSYAVKQRGAIKLHLGTAEVYGKIIFFDRNELSEGGEEVLCQIRLEQPVVTRRGDRFILRRPSPMETIGGGHVIDAHGQRYRFGEETIKMLAQKKEGTPEELATSALLEKKLLSLQELAQQTGLQQETISLFRDNLKQLPNGEVTVEAVTRVLKDSIIAELQHYHQEFPLREGINKAEIVQSYAQSYPKRLTEWLIQTEVETFHVKGPFVALKTHKAHPPKQWEKRVEQMVEAIKKEGLAVSPLEQHMQAQKLPEQLQVDLGRFLTRQEIIYQLDDKLFLHREPFCNAVKTLYEQTKETFVLQEAKESTGLSRKYLVPFLEKLDQLTLTTRIENARKWRSDYVDKWLTN